MCFLSTWVVCTTYWKGYCGWQLCLHPALPSLPSWPTMEDDDHGGEQQPRRFPLVPDQQPASVDNPEGHPENEVTLSQPAETEDRTLVEASFNSMDDSRPGTPLETEKEVIPITEATQIRHGRCANCLSKLVFEIDKMDIVENRIDKIVDEKDLATKVTHISIAPLPPKDPIIFEDDDEDGEDSEDEIMAWEDNDYKNPYNWSRLKKNRIALTTMMLIVNSTMGSALPSNALPFIAAEWQVKSEQQMVLPISVYLIGYIMGPLLWAPMSEHFGRRRLTIGTFSFFTIFTLACAVSPTWPTFLVFRLLTGVFASAPIALVPGIIADTQNDPRSRGRKMGLFFATTLMGPLLAPMISGYCSTTIGWRWSFWIGLIYAGVTMVPVCFLPETFGPVLLLRRARAIRKDNPTARIIAPHEMEKRTLKELTTVVLARPIRMILFEPIVNTSCAYLALCYAIFYMSFEAYPLIFQDFYGLSPGQCGLTYLAIGIGCLLSLPIFFAWDNHLLRAQARGTPWTQREEYRRLPLACLGGPLFALSLFWLGWTARAPVPFIVPVLAGIPFGIGFMCIFQALLNYLTDAYEIFAASANAAASFSRSLLATLLPLATAPLFRRLGIAGACSLLAGLAVLMCAVPFVLVWQGRRIRASSGFCTALRERKEEMARRVEAQRRRRSVRASKAGTVKATGAGAGGPPRLPALGLEGEKGIGMGLVGVGGQQVGDEAGSWSGLGTPMTKEVAVGGEKVSGEGSEGE
ncbi:major facilitator superfamily domain-containing protein [Schizothecium vesticola]|uniref:Major facilitator superfamily domain-containing protein n=1 Tax=Schizothecium vesticola TaxID=314040 RepID=A0AA40EK24_9PEZI|nr:major facilitator superfamily domain-containing protein [Schizothecium vesticola]